MVNSRDFTKRLEKIMDHYDITATVLAEKIDFNRSSISHLISGRNKPSLEFVMKILQNFDEVSWDWLVYGKGNFPSYLNETETKSINHPLKSSGDSMPHSPNLFSQELEASSSQQKKEARTIERIVIFYVDGSFKNYELP